MLESWRTISLTQPNRETDLGTSMTGKRAGLARETGVKKRPDLPQPKTLNVSQVSDVLMSAR